MSRTVPILPCRELDAVVPFYEALGFRVTEERDAADDERSAARPLELVLQAAARQGDARGAEGTAIEMLRNGLERHPDASDAERLPILVYLAELLVRVGVARAASEVLDTVDRLDLDRSDAPVAEQLRTASSIRQDLSPIVR